MEADLERILVDSIQLETENITLKQLVRFYNGKPDMKDQLKNMLHYNQQKLLCAKKIRRELEENKNQVVKIISKKTAAPSGVEITLDNIQLLLGKIEVNLKEGAGYHRRGCELDIEDDADAEDQKKEERNILLDRTEELEAEDTIVQQQRPAEMVTSSEDEDATMETVSTDQERMPMTPVNKMGQVLASTVQKTNAHTARRMSPILSPISKESNTQSSNEENSSEDIGFRPTKNIFSDSSGSSRLRPSAGLHGQSSSSSSRTDLQKLTIKVLKNRLSDLGVEESSFKYDKKQTLVDKVFQLENTMSKKVSKCPPKAKPKAVSKLMKSASESDLGTPPRKGTSSSSKRIFCLTPNQNETKKRKSEEERGRKKTQKSAMPPNAAKNKNRGGGVRSGSQSRSASRSPGRGMTKSSSLFNLKDNGTPVRQGPKSLFDTPKKDEMKKQTNEDKRLEFIRKQKENEEKLRKKKEEQEAERLRKNKEKEEKRLKVKERQEQQKKERQIILEKKNQQAKEKGKGFKDQRAKLEKADALKKEEMKRHRKDSLNIAKKRLKEQEALELAARRVQQEEVARLEALNKPLVNDQTMVLSKHINDATVNLGQIPTTPLNMKNKPFSTSYELTPHGSDKPDYMKSTADNYNIDDLSSGDETDDDENPRKQIPQWATKASLNFALKTQYKNKLQPETIFKGIYAEENRLVDLVEILGPLCKRDARKIARLQRRETECWTEMKEPRQLMDRTLNLDMSCFPPEEPRAIKNRQK